MTMVEEYKKATETVVSRGDYKDRARAEYAACARWAASGRASNEFKAWFNHAPDEPRAWRDYPLPEKGGEA